MRCEEIMSQDVQWIRRDETVARTAKLMAFHNLGLLPVCNADGKAIGVITDRDIALRVVGKDRPVAKTKVGDVMTAPVQFVPPDCPVDQRRDDGQRGGIPLAGARRRGTSEGPCQPRQSAGS